jgi:MoxR-like ATPase
VSVEHRDGGPNIVVFQGADAGARIQAVRDAVRHVVHGKDDVVDLAIVAVLAGGHVLVEDIPGVGKTTLASTLACALGGTFRRVQCTSDLLPADIVGVNVLDPGTGTFRFRPGPVFANIVLADEINRATPRTQSALLEAMNELQVTVDGETHVLPRPFVVLATQNPYDYHGTFPLPDSQLDRFLLRLSMGYPDQESERAILRACAHRPAGCAETPQVVLGPEEVVDLMEQTRRVRVHPDVEDYLLALVARTRCDARLARGASPRAAEGLVRAIRALALLRGRDFAIPEDLRELAVPVLAHRVVPRHEAAGRAEAATQALRGILWDLPAPE